MEANAIAAIKSCFMYLSYVLSPAKARTYPAYRIATGKKRTKLDAVGKQPIRLLSANWFVG
jgi:hypothetical protein